MSTSNFDPEVWSRFFVGRIDNLLRYHLTHHGVGFLHEPPERVRRIERRRAWLRGGWRFYLSAWWYRVRAPIRRLGGCHEVGA